MSRPLDVRGDHGPVTVTGGTLRCDLPFAVRASDGASLRLAGVTLVGGGLMVAGGAHVDVEGCTVRECRNRSGGMGVSVQNQGTRLAMRGSEIVDCQRNGAFVFNGGQAAFEGTIVTRCGEAGLECWGPAVIEERGCNFRDCRRGDVHARQDGVIRRRPFRMPAPRAPASARPQGAAEGAAEGAVGADGESGAVRGADAGPSTGDAAEANRRAVAAEAECARLRSTVRALEAAAGALRAASSTGVADGSAQARALERDLAAAQARVAALEAAADKAREARRSGRGDGREGGGATGTSAADIAAAAAAEAAQRAETAFRKRLKERDEEVAALRGKLRELAAEMVRDATGATVPSAGGAGTVGGTSRGTEGAKKGGEAGKALAESRGGVRASVESAALGGSMKVAELEAAAEDLKRKVGWGMGMRKRCADENVQVFCCRYEQ